MQKTLNVCTLSGCKPSLFTERHNLLSEVAGGTKA